MNLIEKTLEFLQQKNKIQTEKIEKLKGIVKKLKRVKKEAKIRYKSEPNSKKRKKLFKEYMILCKLTTKSQKRLKRIEEEVL